MLDCTDIKVAIIKDLKPISVNIYLIFNELNMLPKEVNLIIVLNRLYVSDELLLLDEDMIMLKKEELGNIIFASVERSIDILSPEYNKYLNLDLNLCLNLRKNSNVINIGIRECCDKIYDLNIFEILLERFLITQNLSIESYKLKGIEYTYYTNKMKTDKKYTSLLK